MILLSRGLVCHTDQLHLIGAHALRLHELIQCVIRDKLIVNRHFNICTQRLLNWLSILKDCPKRHALQCFFETGRLASLRSVVESRSLFSTNFRRWKTKRQATTSLWLCIRPPKWPYFGLPRNATVLQWISPGLQLPRWRARAQFTTTAKASMQPAFFMPRLGHQV